MMKRRKFFKQAGLMGIVSTQGIPSLAMGNTFSKPGQLSSPKISKVEIFRLKGKRQTSGQDWQGVVNPIHIYPNYRPDPYQKVENPEPGTTDYGANYIHITTNDGLQGVYGPIDREAVVMVDEQFKNFILGKNPLETEKIWDQMFRADRHSRAAQYMIGVSAIDNALWDLKGKYFDAPVFRLLGGPTRSEMEVYGSTLGASVQPEDIGDNAQNFKSQGFKRQKWFMPYGPGNDIEGLNKNIEMVKLLREAVGDDVELMFDAFSGWDLNFALKWAREVEQYYPAWIEEAFAADKINSFVELGDLTTIPVASGEHFYNRWQVHKYLEKGALKIVQADPEWCGGVSELVKIAALASVYDVRVIPHGHNIHAALHVVASQSPMTCPFIEYLIDKMSFYYMFEKWQPKPENGIIQLPERPGFGIEFNEDVIEERELLVST